MISETLNVRLNDQIQHELGNSSQYLAIAVHCERECLLALAQIYFKQAGEEREHALKILRFVQDGESWQARTANLSNSVVPN